MALRGEVRPVSNPNRGYRPAAYALGGTRRTRIAALAFVASVVLASHLKSGQANAETTSTYAKDMVARINEYRAKNQVPPLAMDSMLNALAHEHSTAMARQERLSHDAMASRVRRSGWAMCVENVGWNYASAKAQVDGWRASAGHNQNLLDRRVERVGIGNVNGYVTQIACGK